MGFTTHLWKCNKCDEQILYISKQKHPSFNHKCKNKMNIEKERAIEIYESIYYKIPTCLRDAYIDKTAKTLSMLFVNEIIQGQFISIKLHEIEYWKKVKKEINKL
jgi:hypothetical protein